MGTFLWLLSPLDVDLFIANNLAKSATLIKSNDRKKFHNLFDWESLNNVLNTGHLIENTIRVFKNGNRVFLKNRDDITNQLLDGSTLIVESIDKLDSVLGDFTDSLSSEIREFCNINMYLSPPDVRGFNSHYDPHDVYILQVYGSKNWKVYNKNFDDPYIPREMQRTVDDVPYLDCTLNEGDLLYIPRGHWHEAIAVNDYSLHLTLGVIVKTRLDFLEWYCRNVLINIPALQKPLPFQYGKSNIDAIESTSRNIKDVASDILDAINNRDVFEEFYNTTVRSIRSRSRFDLPQNIVERKYNSDTIFKVKCPLYNISIYNSNLNLVLSDADLEMPIDYKNILEFVLSSDTVSINYILGNFPHENVDTITDVVDNLMFKSVLKII